MKAACRLGDSGGVSIGRFLAAGWYCGATASDGAFVAARSNAFPLGKLTSGVDWVALNSEKNSQFVGQSVMITERPDLDGSRLIELGKPDVWLVFQGRRHRVPSSQVYENLFSETDNLVTVTDLDSIARGPELSPDAMLIRADGGTSIYLLTAAYEGGVRRHFIPNYESFVEFGFDLSKVRDFPTLLIDALPTGRDITGAHSPGR